MRPRYTCTFESTLFRVPGPSGWVFAPVPAEHAPGVTVGWGRTPVTATVDGTTWDTSVWREKSGRTILAVPKRVRGPKDDGDVVDVTLSYGIEYRAE
ncbi:MAG TPA: DUF1905 domain-containing protein [Longimicrobiales bacterium]